MAGTNPIFGDLAKLKVDGVWITIGTEIDLKRAWDKKTAPATWGSQKVNKPTEYSDTITVPFEDMEEHVDFLALWNMADGTLKAIEVYPEGDAAGKLMWTGNAYVAVDGIKSGIDSAATGTLTLEVSGGLTASPNIVLAATAIGTAAKGGAGSGYTTLVASGGTSTYAYTLVTQLPAGVTMTSGGIFGGTVDTGCGTGTHQFTVRVTDSAATPVVKDFLCTAIVTA